MSELAEPSAAARPAVSVARIFREFLIIGAISFGGAVPYLRGRLVETEGWVDDKEFVEMLSISQTLPGLNATNLAILVGQKLRGAAGAAAAIIGMCLPGAMIMYVAGILYWRHGERAASTAILKGVAAAAVGLALYTAIQLGRRSVTTRADLLFVALTVVAVDRYHISVLWTLLVVGLLSILWRSPGRAKKAPDA
ncbi:chromate transporter [Rhodoblastus acidophilus]|uniref:Chromate transporter n=1 Tax=Candidatus Rhodoblastus alkanivorans TaxID=2954117 RepID=A0ABS9Z8X4_9HYPH|nr:chromate transporter [Candidatus Rhodoblastus alkanivorans]MCI4677991.1 chromate transporter [Candidatus Rhodoblastus alkanivorans]MCI4683886.1 chromate transporter [Candidatus Rhodoblastus alkanivorans]MDI4641204.1 chromate transporter [Rhodoblastus acidophilus]